MAVGCADWTGPLMRLDQGPISSRDTTDERTIVQTGRNEMRQLMQGREESLTA
jgi:hypothetical protein